MIGFGLSWWHVVAGLVLAMLGAIVFVVVLADCTADHSVLACLWMMG